jgi:16S rRNA (guanine527-N7)-methyltransferase
VQTPEEAAFDHLAGAWSADVSPAARAQVLAYARLLLTWSVKVNLTAASSPEEVVGEHVCDSFAMSRAVPAGASVADVGAGGGLPGIPFALLRPDCRVTLVEPRAKRIAFLRTAVREAGLQSVEVLRARAEELGQGRFDVAASRATFPPETWIRIGLNLIRPGKTVLVFAAATVAAPPGCLQVWSSEYRTAAGHGRWLGAFTAG